MGLGDAVLRVREPVPRLGLRGNDVQAHALDLRAGSGEVVRHELAGQPERLEGLGTAVGLHGGDAHLGHDLLHALAERRDEVRHGLLLGDAGDLTAPHELLGGLHGQVRVHGGGAVAQQQRHVVDLPHVPGLHDQRHPGAGGRAQQVVVHRGGQQQGRDRSPRPVGVPVRDDHELHTAVDRGGDLLTDLRDPVAQRARAVHGPVEPAHAQTQRRALVVVQVGELVQLVVVDDREVQADLPRAGLGRGEHVGHGPHGARHGGHELLADGVQRGVGHLCEGLHEVVVEQPRPVGEHGHGGVGAHRVDGLGARRGHGAHDHLELFLGVAEGLLPQPHGVGRVAHVLTLGELGDRPDRLPHPVLPGFRGGELLLDLGVLHDPPGPGVHEEHGAGGHPALADHTAVPHVHHAHLGREDHEAVLGLPEAPRAQPVAVQHGPHAHAVRERHARRPVPRLHEG